jgi:uncharacterized protein YndB with AHSA1/START domain
MLETTFARSMLKHLARFRTLRLFRNNVGMAWVGVPVRKWATVEAQYITLKDPRPIKFGLIEGSSDYIGWDAITITPEMIGKKVAVFTAIETKKDSRAKKSKEQKTFIQNVQQAGGKAGFASTTEEAERIIQS